MTSDRAHRIRTDWAASTLLGRLPVRARQALLSAGTRVDFRAGSRMLCLGTRGDVAYLLITGHVKVTGNQGGREPLLGIQVSGDLVGEMAALSGAPRSANVIACGDLSAVGIRGSRLRSLLVEHPVAGLEVARVMGERLRWANDRRVDFTTLDSVARVCRVLAVLADDHGQDTTGGRRIGVALTQDELASLAGVRLPTAEKALRALQRRGVVRLGYRTMVVTDRRALDALVPS